MWKNSQRCLEHCLYFDLPVCILLWLKKKGAKTFRFALVCRNHVEGDIFLSRNATRDETQTNYDSENKRQINEWKHPTAFYTKKKKIKNKKSDAHTSLEFLMINPCSREV
jgi:hypothetical protein